MIENLPAFISIVFIVTTFLTIAFLFYAVRQSNNKSAPANILVGAVSFWLFFTATASISGVYVNPTSFPPRLFLFGVLPSLVLILIYFIFFRQNFIERFPLKTLTLLSIIRIPVELVIYWLYINGQMPQIMTFEGWNFDIFSGIAAPVVYWLAFRGGRTHKAILVFWNIFGLLLLINIVSIAILSLESPIQRFAFEQPNRSVLYFPFVWLPAIIVPIVFFSHIASLWKIFIYRNSDSAIGS